MEEMEERMEEILKPSNKKEKLHFIIIPFLAAGHMLPSLDLGRLLASHGNLVTILTTPANAARFNTTTAAANQQPLRFVTVPFSTTPRLPEGCENMDTVPTMDTVIDFFEICEEMEEPVKEWIKKEQMGGAGGVDGRDVPMCIVSDFCHMWTTNLASELGMVRFVFYSICCFSTLCDGILQESYGGGGGEEEALENREMIVPGIPDRVEMTRAQAPGFFPKGTPAFEKFMESDDAANGIIMNTFTELEPDYIKLYERFKGKKVWPIGPVALINKDAANKIHHRTTTTSTVMIDRLLPFLNSMAPDSVIYVCMGSLARTPPAQLIEIGMGLEQSGHPFVWVIQAREKLAEVESWLKESEFEERNRPNGFVIKGWAPQMMILSHPSVGGFLTHCGWNSSMEGITAGVPMLTWPCFFDQFLNERFLVKVLNIGIMVGVKEPTWWWDEVVLLKREEIGKCVKELMGCGKEAVERRKRAKELKGLAELAMDAGGSSQNNLDVFVQEAFSLVSTRNIRG